MQTDFTRSGLVSGLLFYQASRWHQTEFRNGTGRSWRLDHSQRRGRRQTGNSISVTSIFRQAHSTTALKTDTIISMQVLLGIISTDHPNHSAQIRSKTRSTRALQHMRRQLPAGRQYPLSLSQRTLQPSGTGQHIVAGWRCGIPDE